MYRLSANSSVAPAAAVASAMRAVSAENPWRHRVCSGCAACTTMVVPATASAAPAAVARSVPSGSTPATGSVVQPAERLTARTRNPRATAPATTARPMPPVTPRTTYRASRAVGPVIGRCDGSAEAGRSRARSAATSSAHARMASWSRKSPVGAWTARTASRSVHRRSAGSSRPLKTWWPRAATPAPSAVHLGQVVEGPGRVAERAAGEHPHRDGRELRAVALDEVAGRGQPPAHVDRAADQHRVEAGQVTRIRGVVYVHLGREQLPAQYARDLLGDPGSGTVPAGHGDEDRGHNEVPVIRAWSRRGRSRP